MRLKIFGVAIMLLVATACTNEPVTPGPATSTSNAGQPATRTIREAGPLPPSAFKAQLTINEPPTRMRAGEKQTIQVKVKNASDLPWFARGGELNKHPDNRFYLAAGNRWLKSDEKTLVTNMDGRYGLPKDLKPGEETEVPLSITAPKDPGDYILEVDLVQEQVSWFSEKGSPTAKAKVTVVK